MHAMYGNPGNYSHAFVSGVCASSLPVVPPAAL